MTEKLPTNPDFWNGRQTTVVERVHCLSYALARAMTGATPQTVVLEEHTHQPPFNLRSRQGELAWAFRLLVAHELRELRNKGRWKLVNISGSFELERV